MKIFIKQAGFSDNAEIKLLPQSGSNRKFYRINEGTKTAILMQSDEQDMEFDNYIEINKLLRTIGIDVPEIYRVAKEKRIIIEEDIGDLSLQKAIIENNYEVLPTYKSVIDILLRMQILGGQEIHLCKCLKYRKFDYNTLRWETDYFTKYFLEMYCGFNVGTTPIPDFSRDGVSLQNEFHILASKLINEPLYFMHRDFQSQNIFLKDGKVRIIDFQSARQGLLTYDLVALLKDAYVEERVGMQYIEPLLNYYIDGLKDWKCSGVSANPSRDGTGWEGGSASGRQSNTPTTDEFKQIFLYTGLQRNMQALGAFAFLSLVKDKVQFKQYIAPCLRYLKSALSEINEFPELTQIVSAIWIN